MKCISYTLSIKFFITSQLTSPVPPCWKNVTRNARSNLSQGSSKTLNKTKKKSYHGPDFTAKRNVVNHGKVSINHPQLEVFGWHMKTDHARCHGPRPPTADSSDTSTSFLSRRKLIQLVKIETSQLRSQPQNQQSLVTADFVDNAHMGDLKIIYPKLWAIWGEP